MLEKYSDNSKYLSGDYLVGDNFTLDEIKQWYKEEEEAYCELTGGKSDEYLYQNVNNFYGLKNAIKNINNTTNIKILCFGAAYGGEVKGIIELLNRFKLSDAKITIIDSSSEMLEIARKELKVDTVKANVDGKIDCLDQAFDLITCFGVLHHIPNVSYVFSELIRVLKKDGTFLLREPISSMGDWSKKRLGTTINERGLGVNYIKNLVLTNNVKIKKFNFLLFSPFLLLVNNLKLDIDNKVIIYTDYILSKLFSKNIKYNRVSIFKKFAPGSIYLVINKI